MRSAGAAQSVALRQEEISSVPRPSTFRDYLAEELARRCGSNPRYSMRAFARSLKIQSSYLSKVLRGERRITAKLIRRVLPFLTLSPELTSLYQHQARTKGSGAPAPQTKFQLLSRDMFATISNWYHFAILELTQLPGFVNDAQWIGSQLNIPPAIVSSAIERLKRLQLLDELEGKLRCTGNFSNGADPKTISRAQQLLQKEILSLAASAMDSVPAEERDQSSITVACPTSLLPEVKERIKQFRRELGGFIEKAEPTPNRIYHMTISFYPVSKEVAGC